MNATGKKALQSASTLTDLEAVIERGLETFVEVGLALLEIRERRLYKGEYPTFDDYCRERWGMSKWNANRQIQAAEVARLLVPIGTSPANEAQARELAPLLREDEQEVVEVWRAVREEHGEDVTAAHVREAVQRRLSPGLMSSDSAEWLTPQKIVAAVQAVLGTIDLDPCADEGKCVPATQHFTANDDGLTKHWSGRVYMNPPYGRTIEDWVCKLADHYEAGDVLEAIALVPARTDTQWFRRLRDYPVCFVAGRLEFSGSGSAPFPSAAFYLGTRLPIFREHFDQHGDIYIRLREGEDV